MSRRKKTSTSRKKRKNLAIGKGLQSLKLNQNKTLNKETKLQIKAKEKSNPPTAPEEETKPKKKKINILIPIVIVCFIIIVAIFGFKSIYDNNINITNYTFKTNLNNSTAEFSSSSKNLDIIKTDIKDTSFEISLNYDQIKILNTYGEENIKTTDTFFKYYGESDIILLENEKYTIDYIYFSPIEGQTIKFETDNNSISLSNNIINAKDNGEATIYACYGDTKTPIINVLSTNLIVERPKEFDESKEFIKCEQYTNEENEFLDRILEKKIEEAGYQTRAGAVEALRFLALDFPFRINYFNENGRLPNIDGEGRYYHKGLYLSSEKYNDLFDPNSKNKGTWGCSIYSVPLEANQRNGLDCSGLIGWALYNAGFDPEDYRGADLQIELGEIHEPKEIIDSGVIKVGDLVHNEEGDSHIGMVIGIDDEENYYVCQSIWYKPKGVGITKYSKKQFINHWLLVGLMDDYYMEDGNITNMWY